VRPNDRRIFESKSVCCEVSDIDFCKVRRIAFLFVVVCFDQWEDCFSASNLVREKPMSPETHTEPEEIVDDDVPVDAFLDTIGTHVPVSTLPEPPEDEETRETYEEGKN